jgi:hypothetical protein
MNLETFRKKVELKAELSKLEAKEMELNLLLMKEYFAEFKIEGRILHHREYEDDIVPQIRESQLAGISQACFSGATFGLWNDLCKRFLLDLKELLVIQKMDVYAKLEEIG